MMNQDQIRDFLGTKDGVHVLISSPGDGTPEIAWGDTFFSVRDNDGNPRKMPFTTIVVKDYEGFDCDSQLNRDGLYRLNVEVGKEKFRELFGFSISECDIKRVNYDFTALDHFFPHPIYGANGWISIINPSENSREAVYAILEFSWHRATSRAAN